MVAHTPQLQFTGLCGLLCFQSMKEIKEDKGENPPKQEGLENIDQLARIYAPWVFHTFQSGNLLLLELGVWLCWFFSWQVLNTNSKLLGLAGGSGEEEGMVWDGCPSRTIKDDGW